LEEDRGVFKILTSKAIGKRPLIGLGVDWRVMLELILKK
jgi:hypothetical protein